MNDRKTLEEMLFFLKEWMNDLENHLTHAKMALENLRRIIRVLEEVLNRD